MTNRRPRQPCPRAACRSRKVLDLAQPVRRHVVESLRVLPERVADGHAEHLEIVAVLVAHPQPAHRSRPDVTAGECRLFGRRHCVGVITIVGARLLHVAVVKVVEDGARQDAVEADDAATSRRTRTCCGCPPVSRRRRLSRSGTRAAGRPRGESKLRPVDIEHAVNALRTVRRFAARRSRRLIWRRSCRPVVTPDRPRTCNVGIHSVRPRSRTADGAVSGWRLRRSSRGRGRRRGPRDARPARAGCATVDHLGHRPRRSEHDARRLVARRGFCPGDRLRPAAVSCHPGLPGQPPLPSTS